MDVFSVFSHEGTSFREIFLRDLFARPAKTTADQITALALILSRSSMAALCPSEVATALSAAWCAGGYGFKPAAFISCNKDTAWNQTSKIQRWRRLRQTTFSRGFRVQLSGNKPRASFRRHTTEQSRTPQADHQKHERVTSAVAPETGGKLTGLRIKQFTAVKHLSPIGLLVGGGLSAGADGRCVRHFGRFDALRLFRGGGGGTGSRGKPRIFLVYGASLQGKGQNRRLYNNGTLALSVSFLSFSRCNVDNTLGYFAAALLTLASSRNSSALPGCPTMLAACIAAFQPTIVICAGG